jgi:hypothetical protein
MSMVATALFASEVCAYDGFANAMVPIAASFVMVPECTAPVVKHCPLATIVYVNNKRQVNVNLRDLNNRI